MKRRVAVAAALLGAGYLIACERHRRLKRGPARLRDIRHRYATEMFWPGACWCGRDAGHQVHRGHPADEAVTL